MRHLRSIEELSGDAIRSLLDLTDAMAEVNRRPIPKVPALRGRTVVSLFFEDSTRTRLSFETAAKRLSADTMTFSVSTSSVNKGESLRDTIETVSAMGVDAFVVRHKSSGAPHMITRWTDASIVNAGDGWHQHPTQALLDALTIRRHKGRLEGLIVAICGDIAHSRVARSNMHLLTTMGSRVRVVGPPTLIPAEAARLGVEVFHDMKAGLAGADVVMMLRLQRERMSGGMVPSAREFFRFYGLDAEKLAFAKPDSIVMHPGPMNRGVEIESAIADHPTRSVIGEQVEMGVACRMAVLDVLSRQLPRNR